MSFAHARREISSFVPFAFRPYLGVVKKERKRESEANVSMFKIKGSYPNPDELYALEQWAHRERSKALANLLMAGAAKASAFVVRILAPSARTVRKHVVHHA
jgi:hypothetical protein